jgi:hypothetical protein
MQPNTAQSTTVIISEMYTIEVAQENNNSLIPFNNYVLHNRKNAPI